MNYREVIRAAPRIMLEKPCIADTSLKVNDWSLLHH